MFGNVWEKPIKSVRSLSLFRFRGCRSRGCLFFEEDVLMKYRKWRAVSSRTRDSSHILRLQYAQTALVLTFLPLATQYGTSAALRFMRYVDPSLECDLYADKPWALVRPVLPPFSFPW
jgi:hypothetical protein